MQVLPPDGSEDLQLVLSASKCLDLLLVLQTEEFQMYLLHPIWITILLTIKEATNGYSSLTPWTLFIVQMTGSQRQ